MVHRKSAIHSPRPSRVYATRLIILLPCSLYALAVLLVLASHNPSVSSGIMGVKRSSNSRRGGADEPDNKKRKGFSVGPANLPDGTYRRKSEPCALRLRDTANDY